MHARECKRCHRGGFIEIAVCHTGDYGVLESSRMVESNYVVLN